MSYHGKAKAINKGAIIARFDGTCPYPHCQSDGIITMREDWIVKGELGWGHADCVNTKIHFFVVGHDSLCGTTHNQRAITKYEEWDEVTCKTCLKMRDSERYIERMKTGFYWLLKHLKSSKLDLSSSAETDSLRYHATELMKYGIDVSIDVDQFSAKVYHLIRELQAKVSAGMFRIIEAANEIKTIYVMTFVSNADLENPTIGGEYNFFYNTRDRFDTVEDAIKECVEYAELFDFDDVPEFKEI
jgi:hypothetical protein